MSISQLQNAPGLNINCYGVNTNNTIYATGAITFLASALATQNLNITQINNYVYLDLNLPITPATGTVRPITFTNALPANFIPATNSACLINIRNTTGAGATITASVYISNAGVLSILMPIDSVNGNNYQVKSVVCYSLS